MMGGMATGDWIIWGSALSPFHLKLMAMCRHAGLPFRVLPGERSRLENIRYMRRREQLVRGRLPLTWPEKGPLDEFPLVPFLFGPAGENLYDTSAIAEWLDAHEPVPRPRGELVPHHDPAAAFITHVIDEYADEFVLYLIHHQRWCVSARDNHAGAVVAREFRLGPLEPLMARWFSRRQTRRLPYLFSAAPEGFHIDGLPQGRQPPSLPGFPPTHQLLEQAFDRLLDALEHVVGRRAWLLGSRFTLADASVFGELGVHSLADPTTDARIKRQAPHLHAWLARIHAGAVGDESAGAWQLDEALRPLLAEIARTYLPLMRQNAAAWQRLSDGGETCFNERGFDRGRGLYQGTLDGHPFCAVAKTFQVRSWRALCGRWRGLDAASRARVAALMPVAAFDSAE
jgi:glutathione S-transferase